MNRDRARRLTALLLLGITLVGAGCTGAGPAGSATAGTRTRCGAGPADEQRPLFFIFCVESP